MEIGYWRLDELNRPCMRDEAVPRPSWILSSSLVWRKAVGGGRIVSEVASLEIRNPFRRDGDAA